MKPQEAHIAIFWDYENCSVPSNLSGYDVVKQIRSLAHEFGSIKLLKAYTQLSEQTMNSSRSFALRSELQSSGVSITDCPHNKFKNVADQMIIVDMLAFAMDNPSGPATVTIMLISGDRDFAYALSTLQLRKYNIVVVAPSTIHASLRAQTSTFFDWDEKILTGAGKYRPTPNFNQHTRDQSSHSSNDATCTVAAKNSYGPSNAPRCTAFGTPAGAINGGPPYPQNVRSGDSYKKELKPSQACTVADAAIDPSPPRLECSPPCSNVLPPDSPTKSHNNRYSTMRAAADKSPPGYSDSTETFWRDKPSYWASPYKASHVQHFPDNASRGAIHTQTQESSHLSSEPLARPSDQHCGDVDEPSSPRITRPLPYRAAKDISSKQDTGDSLEGPSVGYRDFLSGSQLPSSPSRSRSAEPYFSAKTTKGLASQALNAQQSRNINHSLPTTKGQASKAVNALQSSNINHSLPTTRQTNTQTLPVLSSPIVDNCVLSTNGGIEKNRTYWNVKPSRHTQDKKPDSTQDISSIENDPPPSLPASITSAPFRPKLPEPSRVPASLPKFIPPHFLRLVQHLEKLRLQNIPYPLRSEVSMDLIKKDPMVYKRAGCAKFKDFAHKAEDMGLIRLGGTDGKDWIGLHPDLHGRIEIPGQVSFLNRP